MDDAPMRVGLAPVVGVGPRVLLLGSFPSERSLATGEYYANRRNQFWRLLSAVLGFDPDAPYPDRIDAVTDRGLALWDVVHSCHRVGSMDAKIDRTTAVMNDFESFFATHPSIERVFVNGLTALELYERHVHTALATARLPSSSGALPMTFADKLSRWRAVG